MATPMLRDITNSATTTANNLAGSLTAQIREIERLSSWSGNRELRHWHKQFSEARGLLTARPPEKVDRYAPPELADDDNCSWLELIGAQ
jgi:hypothetical protein